MDHLLDSRVRHEGDGQNVMHGASALARLQVGRIVSGFRRCALGSAGVFHRMARRPSVGETMLGAVVLALVAFVASQVVASPRRMGAMPAHRLSARDSASIASQYKAQVSARGAYYSAPPWLAAVHIARLEAEAER